MKEKIKQLIDDLQKDPNFNNISIHRSEDKYWDYYCSILGFCGDDFFSIIFSKVLGKEEQNLEISQLTMCLPAVEEKLKQFKIN